MAFQWNHREVERELDLAEQKCVRAREQNDMKTEIEALHSIVNISLSRQNPDPKRAVEAGSKALEVARKSGGKDLEAHALYISATTLVFEEERSMDISEDMLKQVNEALVLARDSTDIYIELDDPENFAKSLNLVHGLTYMQGGTQDALQAMEAVLSHARAKGNKSAEAQALHLVSHLQQAKGDDEEALSLIEVELSLRRELKDRAGEVEALCKKLQMTRGKDKRQAMDMVTELRGLSKNLNNRHARVSALLAISDVYNDQDRTDEALQMATEALEISERMNDTSGQAISQHTIAALLMRTRPQKAKKSGGGGCLLFQISWR